MKKNKVIKKKSHENMAQSIARDRSAVYNAGKQVGRALSLTKAFDVMFIAMHEILGFGPKRNEKFWDDFSKLWNELLDIEDEDTADHEYSMECLDRRLKVALPESMFEPWEQRYDFGENHYLKGGKKPDDNRGSNIDS